AGLKIITPSGKSVAAKFISRAPLTDPRIQGASFFYAASAKTGLIPGMSASAVFPTGRPASGLLVPASAVVWWQGHAWAYVETGQPAASQPAGQPVAVAFTRREVSTDNPVDGGWFVSGGFSPKDEIVIKGAETILSQEFLAKPAGGKDEN
ncbi:MAG: multidrug transporter, partial [Nitrospirota bacterium]